MHRGGKRRWILIALAAALATLALAPAAQASSTKRISYSANAASPPTPTEIFDSGGLRLLAQCDGTQELTVFARSTVDDALLQANGQFGDDGGTGAFDANFVDQDFDAGAANQDDVLTELDDASDATDASAGQIMYAAPGKVVTIDYMAEETGNNGDATPDPDLGPFGGERSCAFAGTAKVLDSSSSSAINFRKPVSTPGQVVFDSGGLRLNADCDAAGDVTLTRDSAVDDASVHIAEQFSSNSTDYDFNDDFDPGEISSVLDTTSDDGETLHLVYSKPGATNVSVDLMSAEDALGKDCVVVGTAKVSKSSSSKRVNFRAPGSIASSPIPILNEAGLKLTGTCGLANDIAVVARSTSGHADIHVNAQSQALGNGYTEDDNFNSNPNDSLNFFSAMGIDDQAAGQIVYATKGGNVVTVDYMAEEGANALGGTVDCLFTGTASVKTP